MHGSQECSLLFPEVLLLPPLSLRMCKGSVVFDACRRDVLDCGVNLTCPFIMEHPEMLVDVMYARGGLGFAAGALPQVIRGLQMRPLLAQR